MSKIPHILLAAGTSKRMGCAKQLLPWNRGTLIEHQIITLLKSNQPVFVILGAYCEAIQTVIETYPVEIVVYNDWELGMGNSLAYGLKQIEEKTQACDGFLISLVDQPLVNESHFQKIRDAFEFGNKQIIASESDKGWVGVPVLFDTCYLKELLLLKGEEGAKKLIHKHKDRLTLIQGADLLVDMDTPEMYQNLIKKTSHRS
jgi:molybdenum cofactor cytidylyltransferase